MGSYCYDEHTGDFVIKKSPKLEELHFSRVQMLSIIHATLLMIMLGDNRSDIKIRTLRGELVQLCFDKNNLVEELLTDSFHLDNDMFLSTLMNFNDKQKLYFTALLIVILFAERVIDEKEKTFFLTLKSHCNLPDMTIGYAFDLMSNL